MCPWFPLKAVTGFDWRVAAELRISTLCLSRERILSRVRDDGDVARKATSLDAETSRFNSKPQVLQAPTRVTLLLVLPPQREQVLEVFLALTLTTFIPWRLAVFSILCCISA